MSRLEEHGITWHEDHTPIGFQVGRAAALSEWKFRREADDPAFKRLVLRLQARKQWADKTPEKKSRIREYRQTWEQANRAERLAATNQARRKRRTKAIRAKEAAAKRARRAERRIGIVYVCLQCGQRWQQDPEKRFPSRRPDYCSRSCRAKAAYRRAS